MTAKISFSKAALRRLTPQKNPYWFAAYPGMGVEILPTKNQFIVYAVTPERKPIRYKFGQFTDVAALDLGHIREVGQAALWLIKRKGVNPKSVQGQLVRAVSLYRAELDAADNAMKLMAGGASAVKAVEAAFEHTDRPHADMTLQALFDEYLTTGKGRNIKRKDEYHDQFRRNIPKAWMALSLSELQPEAVGAQYDKVRVRAERQANLTFAKLNTLYNYALANGYILESEHAVRPLRKKLGGFPEANKRNVFLYDSDLPKWYQATRERYEACIREKKWKLKDLVGPYALLVLYTAMRATEARCLAWKPKQGEVLPTGCSGYVDLENRSYCLLAEMSKNNQTELFPLARQPLAILRRLKMRTGNTPWVFPGRQGKPISSPYIQRLMGDIAREAKITDPRVRSHDLRRTTTTIGANVVPGHALDKLTRHASKTMTGKRYVMHDLEKLRRPAQILADEIDRIANLEPPIEITIPREQLPVLVAALEGKKAALSLITDSVPDLAEIMAGLTTEAAA